jgi:hypothetical protein
MLKPDFATNFTEANKRVLRKEMRKAKKMTSNCCRRYLHRGGYLQIYSIGSSRSADGH